MVRFDFFHRCLAIAAAPNLLAANALHVFLIYTVPADSAGNSSQSH